MRRASGSYLVTISVVVRADSEEAARRSVQRNVAFLWPDPRLDVEEFRPPAELPRPVRPKMRGPENSL